jgi:hypothetical protein
MDIKNFKRSVLNTYSFPNAFLTRFHKPFKNTREFLIDKGTEVACGIFQIS